MATREHVPSANVNPAVENFRQLQLAQFYLYRSIAAKKHNLPIWSDLDPSNMTSPELAQWVDFLRDAAHLPPV